MFILFNPKIVPAPNICPKLVVANSSLSPKPSIPDIGMDGPNPLTWIPYRPINIVIRLQTIMIIEFCIDHEVASGNVLINMSVFILIEIMYLVNVYSRYYVNNYVNSIKIKCLFIF